MSTLKVVKNGTHGFYDVFTGVGFSGHTRVRRVRADKGSKLVVISGKPLSTTSLDEALTHVEKGFVEFTNWSYTKYREAVNAQK